MGGSEESSQSIHKESSIIGGEIMLKRFSNINLKAITNNEWITVNRRWIAFAICCISFILVAIQDASYLTHLYFLKRVESRELAWNLAPIPTLIMALLFITSLVLAAYNKKVVPVMLLACCTLHGFLLSIYDSALLYYGIAIMIPNAIVIAYILGKKEVFRKIALVIAIIGVLAIVTSIVCSFGFYSPREGKIVFDRLNPWEDWGPRHDYCCWWELFGHLYPLQACKGQHGAGSLFFPISIGLMYIVLAIGIGLKKIQLPVSKKNKQTNSASKVDGYLDMIVHIALCIFVGGVWQFIWIYRTMAYLNQELDEEYIPWKKLLLCIFVPFYSVYWFYVHGKRLDRLTKKNGINKSDIATTCCVVSVFVPVISCVLMQDRINSFYSKQKDNIEDKEVKDITEEIRKLKALLDDECITQEEFDAKKKQLLGL